MGWAKQNKPGPENYPLRPADEHKPAPRGVFTMDMPWGKGRRKAPKIKGLPESSGADPDYAPGGGTWHSV